MHVASNRTKFLRDWLPALGWMIVIFAASTDLMSAEHTSRFIRPFLQWLNPHVSAATIASVQFAVRKAAHVTEYAVLGALLLRAFRSQQSSQRRLAVAALAFAVSVAWASLDEFHQSFVASRTGSPADVMIDVCGAGVGISAYSLIARRRE
jgi:VanZ family protein